jgi:homoserine O-acetyltransferase
MVEERQAVRSATEAKSASKRSEVPAPTYEGDFVLEGHLLLECGRTLANPTLRYAVYGRLNAARDNVVLVCHELSGSALVGAWWPELFAGGDVEKQILRVAKDDRSEKQDDVTHRERSRGGIVDLRRDCVVCVNLLGSCYGSTGPGSVDPETGEVYGPSFPLISIRDNVRAQALLLDSLGIERIRMVIGGSIGGMQALDWAILFPERVERAAVIAVAPLSAMGLALNHLQRQAICGDPEWLGGNYPAHRQPRRGLAQARQIAMLSYKSPRLFEERFGRNPNRNGEDPWALDDHGGGLCVDAGRFDVAGFLDYQGERFLERFDANAYLAISRTMDTWDPARGFRSAEEAFGRIQAEVTFIGISSDWLFPPNDVRKLADAVRGAGVRAEYREMVTEHGHDAFLAEQSELIRLLHLPESRNV